MEELFQKRVEEEAHCAKGPGGLCRWYIGTSLESAWAPPAGQLCFQGQEWNGGKVKGMPVMDRKQIRNIHTVPRDAPSGCILADYMYNPSGLRAGTTARVTKRRILSRITLEMVLLLLSAQMSFQL